jgi:hypothetical protein
VGYNPKLVVFDMGGSSVPAGVNPPYSVGDPSRVLIHDNPTLTRIRVPGTTDSAGSIYVQNNPQLSELDISQFRNIARLEIINNPSLDHLSLGELSSIGNLELGGNPLIDPAAFDAVDVSTHTTPEE